MAILMALCSSIVWGTSDFLGGLLARRIASYVVVALSQAIGLLAVTVVAIAVGGFGDGDPWLGWSVLAGVTGSLGLVTFYMALATGTMGIVSPIASLGAIVPVAVGLARGESPSVVTSAGVAVALAGAIAASGPEIRGGVGARPVALAVVAGIGFGTSMVFLARAAEESAVMALWGMRATSVTGLAIGIGVAMALGRRYAVRPRDGLPLLFTGVGDAGANLLFSLASLRGYISVVAVLASLYPVMTVLLAGLVLKERLLPVQKVGVVAALAGVVLVSAG